VQLAVFVVEDNAEIQENLVSALEELTCVKVVGGTGTEDGALAWVAEHPTGWDMLIVDLFLKGGSGMRLVQRVQRVRAEQKIVVFSNYVNAGVRKRCAQLAVDAVFDKSTEIDALVDYCSHQCSLMSALAALAPEHPTGGHP
jgi:two-component system OmpR family response regulator